MENYFELLGLPKSFDIKESELHARYVEQQRLHHPDRLVGKSPELRIASIERSMRINDAYETLKSPLFRAEYLLELQGVFVNSDDDTIKPDQSLLMETMELREQLEEIEDGPALKHMIDDVKTAMNRCITELSGAFATDATDRAAQLVMRLKYLGKSLEEAHILLYRFLSEQQTHTHTH